MTNTIVPHWIDNEAYYGERTSQGVHPNTNEVVQTVHSATVSDADKAVASCHAAFPGWRATAPLKRRAILNKAAQLLRERGAAFKKVWQAEIHADDMFVDFNVETSAGMIEECAANITTALAGDVVQDIDPHGSMTILTREPLGVCLSLCPFNAALILSIRAIAAPLAAGNTVLARTSELVPHAQYLWGQLFKDAGLPSGCLNILHVERAHTPDLTKALIEDKRVRHVNFTGSSAVGKHIGRMSGENLKPCILELGGKSPVLVLDDANIEIAANNVLFFAFMNSGQICMSTERIILSPSVHDAFLASLKSQHKPKTFKLASCVGVKRVFKLVEEALDSGAELVIGKESWPPSQEMLEGATLPAMVLDGVTDKMRIWTEETFSPVCVIASKTLLGAVTATSDGEDEAIIKLANDSDYGLAASIFSRDTARAMKIGRALDIGMIRVNLGTVRDDPAVSFGGYKDTGFGRFNGVEGLRAFTHTKAMTVPLSGPQMLPL